MRLFLLLSFYCPAQSQTSIHCIGSYARFRLYLWSSNWEPLHICG
jgi:hypothetical protein